MGPKTALKGTEVISDTFELPEQPFFSCEEDNFSIADGAVMRTDLRFTNLEPLLRLDVGEGNVFEQRPRSASREGSIVNVECDGDEDGGVGLRRAGGAQDDAGKVSSYTRPGWTKLTPDEVG